MSILFRLSGLLVLLAAASAVPAPGVEAAAGAERFPNDRNQADILVVPAGGRDIVICRYRSRAGNCFRLTRTGRPLPGGSISPPLDDEKSFRQFASELLLGKGELRICEVAESWSPWKTVASQTRQARKVDEEERYCSAGIVSDAPACPCRSLRESRKRLVSGADIRVAHSSSVDPPAGQPVQGGEITSRKPIPGLRTPGSTAPRTAVRTLLAASAKEPPRMTNNGSASRGGSSLAGSKG